MVLYSGPNSQQVDRYNAEWHFALLNEDILVVLLMVGHRARGAEFRKGTYLNLVYRSRTTRLYSLPWFFALC